MDRRKDELTKALGPKTPILQEFPANKRSIPQIMGTVRRLWAERQQKVETRAAGIMEVLARRGDEITAKLFRPSGLDIAVGEGMKPKKALRQTMKLVRLLSSSKV